MESCRWETSSSNRRMEWNGDDHKHEKIQEDELEAERDNWNRKNPWPLSTIWWVTLLDAVLFNLYMKIFVPEHRCREF